MRAARRSQEVTLRDALMESLEAENAELRRQLGMNSTSSSTPPSQNSIEA
jgi:hypothetical protein